MSMSIHFGFLPKPWRFEFDGVRIEPRSDYDEVSKWLHEASNADGFLYPPTSETVLLHPRSQKVKARVPRTKRPAHLYQIPASHSMQFAGTKTEAEQRDGPALFVLHLLGYIFGTRLQFGDWWVDMRVPISGELPLPVISGKRTEHFLDHAYRTWLYWCPDNQKLMINILYMYCRSVAYEWDWERFTVDYMVLDACYRLHVNVTNGKKARNHAGRMELLCDEHGIDLDPKTAEEIVGLRNDLFHQTLWGNDMPGAGGEKSAKAFHTALILHRFNRCLIVALLGYENNYAKHNWWSFTNCPFWTPEEAVRYATVKAK